MKKNVGSIDRMARLALAVVLVGAYFLGFVSGTLGIIVLIIAAVMAFTAVTSLCVAYTIIGVNTCCCDAGSDTAGKKEEGSSCCGSCGGDDEDKNDPPKLS